MLREKHFETQYLEGGTKGGRQNSPEPPAASQSLLSAKLYQLASLHLGLGCGWPWRVVTHIKSLVCYHNERYQQPFQRGYVPFKVQYISH